MTSAAFTELIKKGDIAGLTKALREMPSLAEGSTEQGVSFLLLAAYYRNEEAVQLIKQHKSTLDIFEASATAGLERVKVIVAADRRVINAFSSDGFTPLGLACFFGSQAVAEYLIEQGADPSLPSNNSFKVAPLHSATAISHLALVKLLLEKGASVNARQTSGVTPLHSAAHYGNLPIVRLLLSYGADVNAKTDQGQTPLDMALEKNFSELAALLENERTD